MASEAEDYTGGRCEGCSGWPAYGQCVGCGAALCARCSENHDGKCSYCWTGTVRESNDA